MFTLIILIMIVPCSEFPWTKFIDYKWFEMKIKVMQVDLIPQENGMMAMHPVGFT